MKGLLKTLVALIVLVVLWGSFTYYGKRKSRETPKSESKPAERLLPVDASHIQSFTVKPQDGPGFTCAREGKNWSIVAPQKLATDESQVSSFLSSLTSATVNQVADEHPANLKDFGLDPPATTIEVSTSSKPQQFSLLLGDETPTSSGVYAQVAGSPRVVTLSDDMKSSLQKTAFDLRDKRAFTLDTNRIERIDVTAKSKKWSLVKTPDGEWDLNLPPAVRTDRYTADNLVSQLRDLTMLSVVAEEKKEEPKYGLNSPALTVKVAGPSGSQTVVLGKKDGDHYDAMNSALDPIFTLNSDFFTQFDKDPSDLRDKNLFSLSPLDSRSVEVDGPNGRRVFEKQKDQWKETLPGAKNESTDKMEAFLMELGDLRATSFPKGNSTDLAKYGLAKPSYTFKVQSTDNKTETVEVGIAAGQYYARRSTDALPSEISKSSLDDITKALGSL